MTELINREASEKTKGFRLQKFRAISLILEAIEKSDSAHIYAAIEHQEDIYLNNSSKTASLEKFEENKNYSAYSSFTLNSPEVLNTLVSFLDIYIKWGMSENLFLGFYSTNKIGKEHSTTSSLVQKIKFPPVPLLNYLKEKDFKAPNHIEILAKVISAEYKNQYNTGGNYNLINSFSEDEWIRFFNRIDWKFEQPNEIQLKQLVLEQIKNCKFYNNMHFNKEEFILDSLLENFDEKQMNKDLTEKFVTSSDIELIFKKIEGLSKAECKVADPVHKLWDEISLPSDKRNLIDKILSVYKNFDENKIGMLSRRLQRSKLEAETFKDDKSFLSMRYRIYEKCEAELAKMIETNRQSFDNKLIMKWIDDLKDVAKNEINSLSNEFYYSFQSESIVEGIILDLFDKCFLAFDDEKSI